MEHILLHCVKTRVLWELLFSIFGVVWVNPKTVGDTLLSWGGCLLRPTFLLVLEG